MKTLWRMLVLMALFTWVGTSLFPPHQYAASVTATSATEGSTALETMLSRKAQATLTSAALPTQPTRLDIDGAIPIHARVLSYGGDELIPPNGDYVNSFYWTRRGLPGENAEDTTYIFGHTFAGPTPGVFDRLQELSYGVTLHLTTQTEWLQYRLVQTLFVDETDVEFRTDPRIWTVGSRARRGDYVVIVACLLNTDGSLQTGKKTIAVFKKN